MFCWFVQHTLNDLFDFILFEGHLEVPNEGLTLLACAHKRHIGEAFDILFNYRASTGVFRFALDLALSVVEQS